MIHKIHRREFIRKTLAGSAAIAISFGYSCSKSDKKKTNFVFILIDDLGWRDLSCYGSNFYETPHIDKLASQGMRFSNAYAACPVCSPTRASIMTGKYPARLHLTNFLVGKRWPDNSPILPVEWCHQLLAEELTIAELLKAAGYKTGHIGKWHLGGSQEFWPENQGFDVNIGGCQSGMPRSFFWPEWGDNPPIKGHHTGEYLPDRIAEEAVKFIDDNRNKAFFLYLAHYAVHVPIQAKKDYIAKYEKKIKPGNLQNNAIYAGMIQSVDESVGQVMRKLEELEISDRTVVFFMSDNGGLSVQEGPEKWNTPATSNDPLRGGKGHLYEGGIREPWIVKWPGVVEPGSVCSVPVTSVDFYPTILDMAGINDYSCHLCDGVSIVPLLKKNDQLNRNAIYWHYPHYSNQGGKPGGVIRKGDYKLIERYEDGRLELYNLKEDIGEQYDLSVRMPQKAEELRKLLVDWRKAVNAQMPAQNQQYKMR